MPVNVKTGGSDGVYSEIRDGRKEGQVVVRAGLPSANRQFGPQSPFGPIGGKGGIHNCWICRTAKSFAGDRVGIAAEAAVPQRGSRQA